MFVSTPSRSTRRAWFRERHWTTSVVSGALLLATPLVVFLRYQSYPLLAAESLLSLGILMAAGAALACVFEAFGSWARALYFALLVTLLVDIQSDSQRSLLFLAGIFFGSAVILALLRHQLPWLAVLTAVVMFVLSCVGPAGSQDVGMVSHADPGPADPELPVVVHLILDGHIGVEGIPAEFDRDGSHARMVRDLYLRHGFRVFGRAYSRYTNTHNAIPNLLNFDASRRYRRYARWLREKTWEMRENRFFEEMAERGYRIRVIQANYMDYVRTAGELVQWSWTYDPERLNAILDTPLDVGHKIRVILGMFARLSSLATELEVPVRQVAPVASLPMLGLVEEEIRNATTGTMLFAHILLPHGPYALTSDCEVRPDSDHWVNTFDFTLEPRLNNKPSRMMRYPLYLEQLDCLVQRMEELLVAVEQSPEADNMIVVINGDHGSRLDPGPPTMRFIGEYEMQDFADSFSTLFAVRHPAVPSGYDRRLLAIEELFESVIHTGGIPAGTEWASDPEVILYQGRSLRPHPLPRFGRDLTDHQRSDAVEQQRW